MRMRDERDRKSREEEMKRKRALMQNALQQILCLEMMMVFLLLKYIRIVSEDEE